MKLLVTPGSRQHTLIVVDTDEKKVIREVLRERATDNTTADKTRHKHRPFGITWSKDKLFVGNRKNLLVYGKDWKLENVLHDVLDENTHQITWWNDRIISCMTRKDCIQIMKEDGTESEFFHPYKGWGTFPTLAHSPRKRLGENPEDPDEQGLCEVLHINAVNVVDDVLYMLLCGCRSEYKSEIVMLDLKTKRVKNRIFLNGSKAHGLYVDGKHTGVMFSFDGVIYWKDLVFSGPEFYERFLRGMAGDDNEIVIGGSARQDVEAERAHGRPKFITLNSEGIKDEFVLRDYGQINDMRRIDDVDYGHNNPNKFPLSIN